jgi:hypothetical protein
MEHDPAASCAAAYRGAPTDALSAMPNATAALLRRRIINFSLAEI